MSDEVKSFFEQEHLDSHFAKAKNAVENAAETGNVVNGHYQGKAVTYTPLINTPKFGDAVSTKAIEAQMASLDKMEATLKGLKDSSKSPDVIKSYQEAIETAKKALKADLDQVIPSMAHTKSAKNEIVASIEASELEATKAAQKAYNDALRAAAGRETEIEAAAARLAETEKQIAAKADGLLKEHKPVLENIEKLEQKFGEKGIKLTEHMTVKEATKLGASAERGMIKNFGHDVKANWTHGKWGGKLKVTGGALIVADGVRRAVGAFTKTNDPEKPNDGKWGQVLVGAGEIAGGAALARFGGSKHL